MQFDVLSIFPELFSSLLKEGILKRAEASGKIKLKFHNIRDFAFDKHKMTDDRPFGGGEGMVMKPEPLAACLHSVIKDSSKARVILLSPKGKTYSQEVAEKLASLEQLVLICGRYEGVDERIRLNFIDEEISIGDYILTGGELASMVIIDSVTRLIPGVLGCNDSATNDTFSRGLLKYPQYTRPRVFQGMEVPSVLLGGNHEDINLYRFLESVRETLKHRPELLRGVQFSSAEKKILIEYGLAQKVAEAVQNEY